MKVFRSYYHFCIGAQIIDKSTSISSFIRQEDKLGRNRIEQWNDHVSEWSKLQSVMLICFDEIVNQTENLLGQIGGHIGLLPKFQLPLLPSPFANLFSSRISRIFRIRPESTAIINSYKTKRSTAFTEGDSEFINSITFDTVQKLKSSNKS